MRGAFFPTAIDAAAKSGSPPERGYNHDSQMVWSTFVVAMSCNTLRPPNALSCSNTCAMPGAHLHFKDSPWIVVITLNRFELGHVVFGLIVVSKLHNAMSCSVAILSANKVAKDSSVQCRPRVPMRMVAVWSGFAIRNHVPYVRVDAESFVAKTPRLLCGNSNHTNKELSRLVSNLVSGTHAFVTCR